MSLLWQLVFLILGQRLQGVLGLIKVNYFFENDIPLRHKIFGQHTVVCVNNILFCFGLYAAQETMIECGNGARVINKIVIRLVKYT